MLGVGSLAVSYHLKTEDQSCYHKLSCLRLSTNRPALFFSQNLAISFICNEALKSDKYQLYKLVLQGQHVNYRLNIVVLTN